MANWLPFFDKVLKPVTDLIDSLHTSTEEKMVIQERLEHVKKDIAIRAMDSMDREIEHRASIIVAEAKGGWLQRNWRPLLMLTAIVIIFNNYVIVPYVSIWYPEYVRVLELPGGLWGLLTVGVGGYVAGRSGEKIAVTLKNGGKLK